MSRRTLSALLATAFLLTIVAAHPASAQTPSTPSALLQRIAPPSAASMAMFAEAGMAQVHAHQLTPREKARVREAMWSLPPALGIALGQHLDRLSFVDGIAGLGNGLTRVTETNQSGPRYEMTLKAEILRESLSTFLTRKERNTVLPEQRSALHVRARGASALRYVLLHEAAHIWEGTLNADTIASMRADVWLGQRDLVPAWRHSPVEHNAFRHYPPMTMQELPNTYRALLQSPFVSLYATASASEDLAETVAWAILRRNTATRLTISVTLPGKRAMDFHPLRNPTVRRRMHNALQGIDGEAMVTHQIP